MSYPRWMPGVDVSAAPAVPPPEPATGRALARSGPRKSEILGFRSSLAYLGASPAAWAAAAPAAGGEEPS